MRGRTSCSRCCRCWTTSSGRSRRPRPRRRRPRAAGWRGFRLIERKLNGILTSLGLQRIEAESTTFNPFEHEVVAYHDAGAGKEGDVLQVTRQGYRMNGKVLRPAQVVVQAGRRDDEDDATNTNDSREA